MKPEFVLSEDGIKERFKHSRGSGFHPHNPESTNQENTMLLPIQEEEYDEYEDHNSELVSRLQSQNMDLARQVSDQTRKIHELKKKLESFKNGNNAATICLLFVICIYLLIQN